VAIVEREVLGRRRENVVQALTRSVESGSDTTSSHQVDLAGALHELLACTQQHLGHSVSDCRGSHALGMTQGAAISRDTS
jgi:hypothetical protein